MIIEIIEVRRSPSEDTILGDDDGKVVWNTE